MRGESETRNGNRRPIAVFGRPVGQDIRTHTTLDLVMWQGPLPTAGPRLALTARWYPLTRCVAFS